MLRDELASACADAVRREVELEAKFGWYYDKTNQLIDESKALFAEYVEIETEEINAAAMRAALARPAVGSDAAPPQPAHPNAHRFDVSSLPRARHAKMQWL
jgi:hypothetical protein